MTDYEHLSARQPDIPPADLEKMIAEQKLLVAEDNGHLVGCLRYNLFWDKIPFMNFLWIDETHRRKGPGTSLVRHWESELYRRGYKRVMTSSRSDEQGQHFYRKLGYTDCGTFTLPGEPPEMLFFKNLDD